MSGPAHVVSTLNRYVFLDAPNVSFLSRIALQSARVDGSDESVLSIKLTFTFQHSQHAVFLRLARSADSATSSAASPSFPAVQSDEDGWSIASIAATHHSLPIADLQSSVERSARLRFPLFRTVEGCIRVLRAFLLSDASCRLRTLPWKTDAAAFIRSALLPPATADNPAPSPSPASLLSLDLLCSLLYAAMTSARSTTLVNPFPACFLGSARDSGAALAGEEMKETDDVLDVRVDQKLITQQMPRLESAFLHLPPLSCIDFSAASAPAPPASTSAVPSLSSLPPDVLSLLSALLSSHVRLTPVAVQSNLYTLGTSEAHLEAATASRLPTSSLTPPTFQFSVAHPPDPLFKAQAQLHSTFLAYHGSALCNWHSILRRGLESKSGTREQTSGAVFGAGIYFSDDLRVARMFSAAGKGWGRSALGDSLEVVGLYDIINDPQAVRWQEERGERGEESVPDNYAVVEDNRFIRLKSLLVWRAPRANRAEKRGHWMILAYAFVLLVIIVSRIDWKWTTNAVTRALRRTGLG